MSKQLAELLLKDRIITAAQFAEGEQGASQGRDIIRTLVDKKYIAETKLLYYLSQKFGLPSINLAKFEISAEVVRTCTPDLARRSQAHQTTLVAHVNIWSAETAARLKGLAAQFVAQGTDPFTAERRALATLYGDLVNQARVLAYADEFWLFSMIFFGLLAIVPFMRRVRTEPAKPSAAAGERVEGLPVVGE